MAQLCSYKGHAGHGRNLGLKELEGAFREKLKSKFEAKDA